MRQATALETKPGVVLTLGRPAVTLLTEAVSVVASMPDEQGARRARSILTFAKGLRGRWRQRRELSMMDEIGLRDLSLTAADARYELNRPFWSSLSVTGRG